jgi:hypothetical protein
VVGVATQSSKGLRVTTQCRDVEQFVRAFHRYCESSSVFISHARRSVGEVIAFSFDLADGSPALSGLGAVIERFTTADNRFGRPGIVIALHRLTKTSKRVFGDLSAARGSAPEPVRRDETPALASARGVTSTIQMIDPEGLTPIPQPPPRSVEVPRTQHPRTATRPIAVIATSSQAKRTPPSMKIPASVMPSSPVSAHETPSALAEGTEVAHVDPVDEQSAPPQPVPVVDAAGAVIEQPDAMAEQTARMASPPYVDLVPRTPDAPILASADAFESGHSEVAPLPPPPLELPAAPVPLPETDAPAPAPIEQTWAPAMAAVAVAAAQPPPVAVSSAMPSPSTRWTKQRIWGVAAFGGASLLALGIVIGATVFGRGMHGTVRPAQAVLVPPPTPAPPATTPAPPATTPAPPATTPASPPTPPAPAPPTPAPAPKPAVEQVAAATAPAHAIAKPHSRPKTPVKRPPHARPHKHAAAGCTSLECL